MKETSSSDQKSADLQRRPWPKPAARLKVSHQRPQHTRYCKAQATSGATHNEGADNEPFAQPAQDLAGTARFTKNGCSRPAQGGADDTFPKANQSQYDLHALPDSNNF